jgi:uncharacterized protein
MDREKIQEIIDGLPIKSTDIKGVLVATLDGISIADCGVWEDANRIGAMTAAALGLCKRMIETANAGILDEISVAGVGGRIFIYAVGEQAVMVILTRQTPNIGLINWEARKAIVQLSFLV